MEKIYLAMYAFGMDCTLSMEEKLKAAAEMGYAGVEFFGDFQTTDVMEMKRLLATYHLEGISAHVMAADLEKAIPYMAEIGGKMIIVPMQAFANKEEALDFAKLLDENGQEASKYGMKVGYHNHTSEFYLDEGKYLLDYVIENTNPEYVSFQLDCGWTSAAGIDPVEYINKYAGRFIAIHIKENSKVIGVEQPKSAKEPMFKFEFDENGRPIFPPGFLEMMEEHGRMNVPTGTGIVDWKAIKAAADAQGCLAYILEREWSYNVPPDRIACLKEDIAYLKENIFLG